MENRIPSRLCPYCENEKPWIFSGKKLKDGSKIYTNEFAVRWAGRRCPDCERSRVQAAVRCDRFERDQIVKQLEQSGYQVSGKTLPLFAQKDGQTYSVEVRHAQMDNGRVVLGKKPSKKADLYALVFSSVRIIGAEQMSALEPQAIHFVNKKGHHRENIQKPDPQT